GEIKETGNDSTKKDPFNPPPTMLAPIDPAPSDPVIQVHGSIEGVVGKVATIDPVSLMNLQPDVQVVVEGTSALTNGQAWWLLKGRLDGDAANGRVTYLAGHDYLSTDTNIIPDSKPRFSGARVMLNSLFDAGCATSTPPDSGQPVIA